VKVSWITMTKDMRGVMRQLTTIRFMAVENLLVIFLSTPMNNTMIFVGDMKPDIMMVAGIKEWEDIDKTWDAPFAHCERASLFELINIL